MSEPENETLLEFPCEFGIKAMGESSAEFNATVMAIIQQHTDDIAEDAVTTKQSSGGKFTSITVNIKATSKAQLDAIYQDLHNHEMVKYIL